MNPPPSRPVIYDTGALVAAERGGQRFRAMHQRWLAFEIVPVVPSPVLAQVWRNGTRQVGLTRTLRGCQVMPIAEEIAKQAGVLLGRSRTADAIDAIVVATAVRHGALMVTSDPRDLRRLWDAADTGHEAGIIEP